MRKRMYIFLLSFTLLVITGCATEASNTTTTPTFTPIVENEVKDATKTPTPTIKEETNSSTKTPTPTKASSSAFLPNTKQEETKIITKAEGLCEQLEKTDASLQASYNSFNRMLSMDDELALSGQSRFCIDETTGVVYFVNQGKDYYLYRMKDGEVQLAVAMPVKQIYAYQGFVYFMIENYKEYELGEFHNGDIYCYTPTTGTVELVYEAGAIENSKDHRLTVNEKGIYFSYFIQIEQLKRDYYHCYLPFGASEPVEDTERTTWKGWDNYVFEYTSNGVVLQNRNGEIEDNIELSNRTIRFCVKGDYLYSAERTYISCLNLKTGEETKYDFLEMWKSAVSHQLNSLEDNSGVRVIESFVVTETDIWVTGFGMILGRLNLETNEFSYNWICKDKNDPTFYTIIELYTDGEQLYVTCGDLKGDRGKRDKAYFARIQPDIVGNIAGRDVMVLEDLVE